MQDAEKELLLTPHECLSVAEGRRLQCRLTDGETVWVRLPTAEEFRQITRDAQRRLAKDGIPTPRMPTDEEIAECVRPLDFSSLGFQLSFLEMAESHH